ncbi:MAG TPA: DNA methyltransferase [Nitrospira sp.]|nr:DNA methyltransferase [Nitrospira sp.]
MKTEAVSLASLQPNPRNSRVHSRKQISQIAKSIEKFGFVNPVLTDDNYQIIAGHGRYEAAKQLGIDTVPAIRLSHLSPTEVRAYVIADNRLAEKAGWDREMLQAELQGLLALDIDIELTGFEAPDLDALMDEAREALGMEADEDRVPLGCDGPTVARQGQLWLLGNHRLYCGDARTQASYDALFEGSKAAMVIGDAPYNVKIANNVSGNGRIVHGEFQMASGEMSKEEFTGFLETVFQRLAFNTVDGSIHMLFMDWRHQLEMMVAGNAVYSELKNLCVWNKSMGGMGTLYRSKHELVYVWKSGLGSHRNNVELGKHGRNRTNVWDYAGVTGHTSENRRELEMHPTVKPVALIADAIKDVSVAKDLVLDPFCGSGTILIAAERTGRHARAIEIDLKYVDVAIRRWQLYTGKHATDAATGMSFEECEEAARSLIKNAE